MYMDSMLPALPGLLINFIQNLLIFGACLLLRMDVNNYTSSTDFLFMYIYMYIQMYLTLVKAFILPLTKHTLYPYSA